MFIEYLPSCVFVRYQWFRRRDGKFQKQGTFAARAASAAGHSRYPAS
ncbi:hypothetical protein SBA6_420012 [Candidatus Sulfopaludibacter sp. SbA6]|nr:hypothetical protein SBA6_420012 [Candidatus Sulfopaludibacter sp. SbA6]